MLHSLGNGFRQPFFSQLLLLSLGLGRIFPGNIAVQILQQVVAGGLKLVTNQPQPQQPNPEGVLLVAALCLEARG